MELAPEAHADINVSSNAGLIAQSVRQLMRRKATVLNKLKRYMNVYIMVEQKVERSMWMVHVIHRFLRLKQKKTV